MNSRELFTYFKIKKVYGKIPEQIDEIYHDSRQVKPNSMFICTRGFTTDGHDYYRDAIEKGASIIVAEKPLDLDTDNVTLVIVKDTHKAMAHIANKFYGHPSSELDVIGVTGTNGKTTVTTLIYKVLRQMRETAALSGTIGFEIEGENFPSDNTTCDILTNQKFLSKATRKNVENMVMEVSSHGLCQGRLWGIDFNIVTFTNLSQDHLDYHETMEEYGYVKGLLFAQLGQDLKQSKYLVLNIDDPWFNTYSYWSPYEVISYGINDVADFKAVDIHYADNQTAFTLLSPEGNYHVQTNLLGEFNVYNCLAAIASLFAKGLSVAAIVGNMKEIPPIKGRMEKVDLDVPVSLYIDYAHTADAIEKSIASILPFKEKRIIFLVGTGGDRDPYKRPLMAEKASLADYVVLTVNDPRYENPEKIVRDMEKGMKHNNYAAIPDRQTAIAHAIEVSKPGDILVFAGKGQEDYQIVENKKQPHSDYSVVHSEVLKKFRY